MENNFVFHAQENDEGISLADFPMSPYPLDNNHTSDDFSNFQNLRSPSDQSDLFEFSNELNNMSHAESYINFCGKLIPLKSSPELKSKKNLFRDSSFDSDSSDKRSSSSSSTQSSSRFDGCNIKNPKSKPKPSWYIMLFGSLIVHREMNLRDIKNRQVRRTTSAPIFFPATETVNKPPVRWKKSWGKVWSCRNYASVHVTTSLACMPRV